MAPQVLQGVYTSQADMWAVGVLTFVLLSSEKPFDAPDKYVLHQLIFYILVVTVDYSKYFLKFLCDKYSNDIIVQIMKCDYNFDATVWKTISDDAKTFITKLIETDPEDRLTAVQANEESWLKKIDHPDKLSEEFVKDLHKIVKYHASSSLMKKIGLLIIAHNSSTFELHKLRKLFREYDINNDGKITFEDFRASIQEFGYSDNEVKSYFQKLVSIAHTGSDFFC